MFKNAHGYVGIIIIVLLALTLFIVNPIKLLTQESEIETSKASVTVKNAGCQPVTDPTTSTVLAYKYYTDNEYKQSAQGHELEGQSGIHLDKTLPKMNYNLIVRDAWIRVGFASGELEKYAKFIDEKDQGTTLFTDDISEVVTVTGDDRKYRLYYPDQHGTLDIKGPSFNKADFEGNPDKVIEHMGKGSTKVYQFGLVFLAPLEGDGNPTVIRGKDYGIKKNYVLMDVYQDPAMTAVRPLPQIMIDQCQGTGDKKNTPKDDQAVAQDPIIVESGVPPHIELPAQTKSETSDQLQLEYFLFGDSAIAELEVLGVWNLHCKPAIYLYPKVPTNINVKVKTKGFLTYTDPKYLESSGWNVLAYPDGTIYDTRSTIHDKPYPYLYYESKVPDGLVKIPEEGYIVPYDQFVSLHKNLLPKLGLLDNQIKEYIDYWSKALPYLNYYFVGIMPQEDIDKIEPLDITPKPDQNIRVRLYYQLLDHKPDQLPKMPDLTKLIPNPYVLNPNLKMIEWGGMVKLDKDHPFTCSQ